MKGEECATNKTSTITNLDALQAFVWALVVRARKMTTDKKLVSLNTVVGLRARLKPPLPTKMTGMLAFMVKTDAPGTDFAVDDNNQESGQTFEAGLGRIARRLRDTVDAINSDTAAAYLHDKAHQVDASRIWPMVPSKRQTISTAWTHVGLYDVDFTGGDATPDWVEVILPGSLLCITEAPKKTERDQTSAWSADGVNVYLRIDAPVMERLLKDPLLGLVLEVTNIGNSKMGQIKGNVIFRPN